MIIKKLLIRQLKVLTHCFLDSMPPVQMSFFFGLCEVFSIYNQETPGKNQCTFTTFGQVILSIENVHQCSQGKTEIPLTIFLHPLQLTAPQSLFSHRNSFSSTFSMTTLYSQNGQASRFSSPAASISLFCFTRS